MGYTDALAAMAQTENTQDTLQYFALKKKRDSRVEGVTYEKFLELKAAGQFSDFKIEEQLQSLFLQ